MSKSLKKNFGYNLILTFCNYLFPLLTYPYVSRVLGVDKIGICNFVDGIINYFVLFSALGIGSYGVREIAKCRDDYARRSFVFSNLITLNIIGTLVAVLILIASTLYVPSLSVYRDYLWIGVFKLLFNVFLIEWFFQGLQEFRYITIRSVIVRLFYVIGIFCFVRQEEDVIIYYALMVLTTIISAILNWSYSRRFRQLSFRNLNLKLFITPVLIFGYYRILTSMYTSFNLVFLGFTSGDTEVGYFATATKLYTIIMAVLTALTTVMVPKVSELLAQKDMQRLQDLANKTFSLLTAISFPIIIFCFFFAKEIIYILSGSGYEGAIVPFRIVIFLLLIIGMEQIVIQQFLMASTSNKSIFIVSTVGAVVGLSLNFILTPHYGAIGSAISWGISEFSVLIAGIILMKKYVGISLDYKILSLKGLFSFGYILWLSIVFIIDINIWLAMIISFLGLLLLFIFINKDVFQLIRNNRIFTVMER